MTTADEQGGAVVVPRSLASTTFAALLLYLQDRVRADGGALSPEARALLHALNRAAQAPSSDPGTSTPAPATVDHTRAGDVLGMEEVAALLGCSPEYARRLARTGRFPARRVGHVWLTTLTSLDAYRYGREEAPDDGEAGGQGREGRDRAAAGKDQDEPAAS